VTVTKYVCFVQVCQNNGLDVELPETVASAQTQCLDPPPPVSGPPGEPVIPVFPDLISPNHTKDLTSLTEELGDLPAGVKKDDLIGGEEEIVAANEDLVGAAPVMRTASMPVAGVGLDRNQGLDVQSAITLASYMPTRADLEMRLEVAENRWRQAVTAEESLQTRLDDMIRTVPDFYDDARCSSINNQLKDVTRQKDDWARERSEIEHRLRQMGYSPSRTTSVAMPPAGPVLAAPHVHSAISPAPFMPPQIAVPPGVIVGNQQPPTSSNSGGVIRKLSGGSGTVICPNCGLVMLAKESVCTKCHTNLRAPAGQKHGGQVKKSASSPGFPSPAVTPVPSPNRGNLDSKRVYRGSHSQSPDDSNWQCLKCTLINKSSVRICELCGASSPHMHNKSPVFLSNSPKLDPPSWPSSVSSTEASPRIAPFNQRQSSTSSSASSTTSKFPRSRSGHDFRWRCQHCTLENEAGVYICDACGKTSTDPEPASSDAMDGSLGHHGNTGTGVAPPVGGLLKRISNESTPSKNSDQQHNSIFVRVQDEVRQIKYYSLAIVV
jgi:predicted RNA-binding Zn-ribbon protein involved in translation (DUF1610 family)